MRKLVSVFCIICLLMGLNGCYDHSEANDLVYAVALGIDEGTQNDYEITIQYAKVFEINTGSESGESEANILDNITISAPTIYSAVNFANHLISKRFVLSHVKLIVFSEGVARNGLSDFAELMMRSSDLRPHAFTAIARGSAKDYLNSVKPSIEINPVKYYDLIYNNSYSSYVPKSDAYTFCAYIDGMERDLVMPVAGTVSKPEVSVESVSYNPENDFEYKMKNYIAGDRPRDTKNPSEVIGMALFSGDKLAGMCGSTETEIFNMLSGNFTTNYTTFYNSLSKSPITVKLTQERCPKICVDTSTDIPSANIELYFESEFLGLPSQYVYENDLTIFENEVSNYIKSAADKFLAVTQDEYNSDVLGLGTYIKGKFPTYQNYLEYDFNNKYKDIKFNVTVNYKVRRTGLIIRQE